MDEHACDGKGCENKIGVMPSKLFVWSPDKSEFTSEYRLFLCPSCTKSFEVKARNLVEKFKGTKEAVA